MVVYFGGTFLHKIINKPSRNFLFIMRIKTFFPENFMHFHEKLMTLIGKYHDRSKF